MTKRIKKYNKERHLELVENSENLTQQERSELSNYRYLIADYIFWIDRHHYLILLNNFNIELMKYDDFQHQFYKLWFQSMVEVRFLHENLEELRNLSISNSKEFYKFSSLITCIVRSFDELADEEISYQELADYVKTISREIKLEFNL